jgi:hypothetical protein
MKTLACVVGASVLLGVMVESAERKTSTQDHAYLELTLENKTGEEIDQAAIVLGKNRCTSGILGKGAAATYLGWQKPVGTNAVVQWRDSKQTKRESEVSLVDVYKPAVDGRLVFSITPTNVVVKFVAIERRPSGL